MTFALTSTLSILVGTSLTQPTRMGKLPAGTLVINDSAVTRVWISPYSAVGTGAGTPLDPKTTMRLTVDGDWYGIIDNGDTAAAQLYVTPYADQWQPSPTDIATATALAIVASGVPFIDQPLQIGFAFPTALPFGTTQSTATIDVTRWQSYYSWFGWDPAVFTYLQVTLVWLDGLGNIIDQDIVVFNGQGAGSPVTALGRAFIRGPIRGSMLRISFTNLSGSVNGNYNYSIYGSLRNVQSVRCIEDAATGNIITDQDISPGAGPVSLTQPLPLYSGQVAAGIQAIGTTGQTIRVIVQTGATTKTVFDRTYTIGTTPADYGLGFIFPRMPMKILVTNNGASAINGIRTTFIGNEPA